MKSKTILVVDDSLSEQRLIEAILRQIGLTVETADSAESALNWVAENVPALMVVDVVMPGLSGFELCRKLRSNPETEKVPIIFCTSKSEEFDRFWGMRQGGTDYLTKPFAPNELIDVVRKHLPV